MQAGMQWQALPACSSHNDPDMHVGTQRHCTRVRTPQLCMILTQRLAHLPQHLQAAQQRPTDQLHLRGFDATHHTNTSAARRCSCAALAATSASSTITACCQASDQLLQVPWGATCCSQA